MRMFDPGDDPERPFEHICFTVPWNFTEQPAVSIDVLLYRGRAALERCP